MYFKHYDCISFHLRLGQFLILLDQLPWVSQGLHVQLLLQCLHLRFQEDVLLEYEVVLGLQLLLPLDSLHYPFELLPAF